MIPDLDIFRFANVFIASEAQRGWPLLDLSDPWDRGLTSYTEKI